MERTIKPMHDQPARVTRRTTGSLFPAIVILAVAGALLLPVGRAAAQIPPEIPLIPHLGTGARAMGMGGAYTAVADDYEALSYNPAGLAQIRRIEFGGAIDHVSLTQENTYLGTRRETKLSKGNLQSLGFAYPFPTYRGSLVFGISYDRERPLDQDYFRKGSGPLVSFEEETMRSDGGVGAWRAGLAGDVSPDLSLGAGVSLLTGSSTASRDFVYLGTNTFRGIENFDSENTHTTDHTDYTAFSGNIGALVRSSSGLRFGLALFFPERFELKRSGSTDILRYQQITPVPPDTAGVDIVDIVEDFGVTDHVQLPFRVAGGLSYVPQGALQDLLLTVDAVYSDWSQIEYNDEILRDANGAYAYGGKVNLRAGAEYTVPNLPLRLRAGYIYEPVPYELIGTDVFMGTASKADWIKSRQYGTVGFGVLLQKSLTLDVAYVFGGYERAGTSEVGRTNEKQKEKKAYFGAAFRL